VTETCIGVELTCLQITMCNHFIHANRNRDIVEVRMDLGGVPCIVSDTAGLRTSSGDVIEIEGMKRARCVVHSYSARVQKV
jgi:hypothetical protein